MTAVAVMFETRGGLDEVPIADVAGYSARHPASPVRRVRWADGSWSWAKCWWHDVPGMPLARIGAGAYGDLTVWENPAP